MTETQSFNKIDVSSFETTSQLFTENLVLIDSLVELTPRDTITRVRYVRATKTQRTADTTKSVQTTIDTTATKGAKYVQTPIAVEEYKKRGSVALRHVRTACGLLLVIFFALGLRYVKKCLLLRRK